MVNVKAHVKVFVTRDSVAAGDDIESHDRKFKIPDVKDIPSLVREVVAGYDLPRIGMGQATWCLASGSPLAVVAQQWSEPKIIASAISRLTDCDIEHGVVRLHFSYLAQIDPTIAFDVLSRLRLKAAS
jgi:hypothetical protein